MKKTVSFLLALIMICCMAVPAYAAENETLVTLTVDESLESYEVTIPPTLTLDPATFARHGEGETALNVTIDKLTTVWSTSFLISVKSKNKFCLVNTEDSSKMIEYSLRCNGNYYTSDNSSSTVPYFSGKISDISAVLEKGQSYNTTVTTSDGLQSGYLARWGSDAYPGSGTYTDTLIFTFAFSNK